MSVVKIELCKAYLLETPILIDKGFEVVKLLSQEDPQIRFYKEQLPIFFL